MKKAAKKRAKKKSTKARKSTKAKKPAADEFPGLPGPLADFVINNVRLVHSEALLTLKKGLLPNKTSLNVQCRLIPVEDEGNVISMVSLSLTSVNTTDPESAIRINLSEEVVFSGSLPKGVTEEESAPIVTTSLFVAWPYIREYVHSTVMKMGLPPLVLPRLKANLQDGRVMIGDQVVGFSVSDGADSTESK